MKELKEINGTFFYKGTDEKLANALLNCMHSRERIRLFYGKNGVDWGEENDVTGRIGRSTGPQHITILVNNARSLGGGAILTDCIVRLQTTTGRVIWSHPNCKIANYTVTKSQEPGYTHSVLKNGELYANCKSERQAKNLAAFMRGERGNK